MIQVQSPTLRKMTQKLFMESRELRKYFCHSFDMAHCKLHKSTYVPNSNQTSSFFRRSLRSKYYVNVKGLNWQNFSFYSDQIFFAQTFLDNEEVVGKRPFRVFSDHYMGFLHSCKWLAHPRRFIKMCNVHVYYIRPKDHHLQPRKPSTNTCHFGVLVTKRIVITKKISIRKETLCSC